MLEYCMCPKCERMIMLDPDFATGFCLYCGTHIAYEESREFLLEGLKSTLRTNSGWKPTSASLSTRTTPGRITTAWRNAEPSAQRRRNSSGSGISRTHSRTTPQHWNGARRISKRAAAE